MIQKQFIRPCHDFGWIVIPLSGKIPPQGFQLKEVFAQRIQGREEIAGYFPDGYRGNVGIVTGKGSGLVVVDLDSSTEVSWAVKRFGNTPFIVQTGKQGFHFYYRYPNSNARIGNRVRLWGRQIDLRACFGYVVAPPSLHPETGKAYRWITPLEELSLTDMPVFDPDLLSEKKVSSASSSPPTFQLFHNKSLRIKRARRYLSTIVCVSGNAAHNTLFRACCKLIELFNLSENEMQCLLSEWNQTNCFDQNQQPYPWSEKELAHKIIDSFKITNSSKTKGTKSC